MPSALAPQCWCHFFVIRADVGRNKRSALRRLISNTRAFGPGSEGIPERYRSTGQPVFVPGSMGTASYVLAGTGVAMSETFGSTCHGAGRLMSRHKAKQTIDYNRLRQELHDLGIEVRAASAKGLIEEAPAAYKDVEQVVGVMAATGVTVTVARLVPIAIVKG